MTARTPSRIGLTRWLIGHTRRLVPVLGVAVVARIAGQLMGVALLVLAADAIARTSGGAAVSLPGLVGLLAGVALGKALLRYLEHYAGHWVAFTALQRLRELFFDRLIPQAPAATTGRAGTELTERATRDIDRIEVFFAHTLPPAVAAVAVPGVALAWLASVSPPLALTLAGFTLVVLVVPLLAGRATWSSARAVAEDRGAVAAHLGDDLQGVREIVAFDATTDRLAGLDAADRALTGTRSRAGAVQGARTGMITVVQGASLVVVVAVGSAAGTGAPVVLTALAVGIGLWTPARGIDDFVAGLDAAFAAAVRVREVVDAPPRVTDPASPLGLGQGSRVDLEQVGFSYPHAARPALDDVTIRVEPGTWSYLVGVSGSGKSTLAHLLLRGWDAECGSVRFAGTEVSAAGLDELRSRIALVPQHPVVLSGTVADNLRLANADADADATSLRLALHTAGLDQWVAELPEGLDTPLTGRGVSGGQLQRLALARALVGEPDLLILDEALSQLDADTAGQVRERLLARTPRLTILEITHRADLVPAGAPVVVLDAGRVLEHGTAAELRVRRGAFSRLELRH